MNVVIGTLVNFEIRNRGGVRYASQVTPISSDSKETPSSVAGERTLSGHCLGVVIASPDPSAAPPSAKGNTELTSTSPVFQYSVHPLDFSSCPELMKKFVDLPTGVIRVLEKKWQHSSKTGAAGGAGGVAGGGGPSEASSWEKVKPNDEETKSSSTSSKRATPSAASASAASGSAASVCAVDGTPVYYPPLSVSSFPLTPESVSSPEEYLNLCVAGTLVEFRPIVNWTVARGLFGITDVVKHIPSPASVASSSLPSSASPSSTAAAAGGGAAAGGSGTVAPMTSLALLSQALVDETSENIPTAHTGRVKGTIIRLTINVGQGMELAEISRHGSVSVSVTGSQDNLFYCESKELRFVASGNVHVGDEVEFLPASFTTTAGGAAAAGGATAAGAGGGEEEKKEQIETYEIHLAIAPILLTKSSSKLSSSSAANLATNSSSSSSKRKPLNLSAAAPPKPIFKTPITMANVQTPFPCLCPFPCPSSLPSPFSSELIFSLPLVPAPVR
jgi:hypothetical protein